MSGFAGGASVEDSTRFKGASYTATASSTTTHDLQVPADIHLFGGHYWVKDAALGDTLTFQVVDVDNILGGGAGAVVTEYITDMPIPPWNHERDLDSPTHTYIPTGLYLRVTYVSTGGTNVSLGVTYKWFLQE